MAKTNFNYIALNSITAVRITLLETVRGAYPTKLKFSIETHYALYERALHSIRNEFRK